MTSSMAKTCLVIGLTTGALVLGLGLTGALTSPVNSRADAGLVSTLPLANATTRNVPISTIAIAPDAETREKVQKPSSVQSLGVQAIDAVPVAKDFPRQAGTGKWDNKPRSASVAKIEQAFDESMEVNFVETPIKEAMKFVEAQHQIQILFDEKAITEAGTNLDEPVSLVLTSVTLRSVLDLIVERFDLDYVIKHEVLLITTSTKAANEFETRVYNVDQLGRYLPADLLDLIQKMTSAQWEADDGEGGAVWARKNSLVVRQTQRVHREITELLDQLASAETTANKTP